MLLISDRSRDNEVIGAQTIWINQAETNIIRQACQQQCKMTYDQIEYLVDLLYQLDIDNIWPNDR